MRSATSAADSLGRLDAEVRLHPHQPVRVMLIYWECQERRSWAVALHQAKSSVLHTLDAFTLDPHPGSRDGPAARCNRIASVVERRMSELREVQRSVRHVPSRALHSHLGDPVAKTPEQVLVTYHAHTHTHTRL